MKKVLIIGRNSYIGASFRNYLGLWRGEYEVSEIDVHGEAWKDSSFQGYDCIVHVAGIAHINTKKLNKEEREVYWYVNAELPVQVATKAKDEGVRQFIFLSSMSVYGEIGSITKPVFITKKTCPNPKDIYGKSKLHAEKNLDNLRSDVFHICILRPPMIYGAESKGNYRFLVKAAEFFPFFPKIKNERSMLSIDNFCVFLKGLVDNEVVKDVLFPQDEQYVCTSDMVRDLALANGKNIKMTDFFNPVLIFLSGKVAIVDKVFGSLVYNIDEDQVHNWKDI